MELYQCIRKLLDSEIIILDIAMQRNFPFITERSQSRVINIQSKANITEEAMTHFVLLWMSFSLDFF